jgi:HD-GYP domain-containing protein (c-di-GMP phosphodiesterase class II)
MAATTSINTEIPVASDGGHRGARMRFFRGIHRVVALRLAIVWIVLTLAVGGAVTYLELQRVDRLAFGLAMSASEAFRNHVGKAGSVHEDQLHQTMQSLLKDNFVHVQLVDTAGSIVAEAAATERADLLAGLDGLMQATAMGGEGSHRTRWRAGRLLVQVSVPLGRSDGSQVGSFYGTYLVDAEASRHARADLIRNVAVVVLVLLVTALALYPVIVGLNRGVLQLSTGLMRSNIELMEVLGSAIAKRDSDTDLHNYRVCIYSIRFAEALGLSEEAIRSVVTGAFLHDVGKIGISDTILLKPGKLTTEEFEVMKGHVQLGMDIVARSSWLKDARDVIVFHHERFDGSGYMHGLNGEAIPLAARLFAIVDVFDALTSRRPYKEPLPVEQSMRILDENRGSHFDPRLLDVFSGFAIALHAELDGLSEQKIRQRLHDLVTKYFFEGRDYWEKSGCPAWLAEQCGKRDV